MIPKVCPDIPKIPKKSKPEQALHDPSAAPLKLEQVLRLPAPCGAVEGFEFLCGSRVWGSRVAGLALQGFRVEG